MEDIIHVLECFSPVFSARVWQHALILLIGASQGTHGSFDSFAIVGA